MTLPLSLYVHIPWCARKCPYCDFNSYEAGGAIPEEEYIGALLEDLRADIAAFDMEREIRSVFFGGGTPSLLSPASVAAFLTGAARLLPVAQGAEVTLEANPGTVREGARKFAGFLEAGVNRLSIGVQSFDDANLARLGRIHSAVEARHALQSAREAGFTNINLDLMHGLPGQTVAAAMRDLEAAVGLAPEHISWYQLTIEPNTVFHKRPPRLPDEDVLWDIYQSGLALLSSNGYRRYEVSAFAKDDRTCYHNLNYWQFGDYLGVGAGAHGKLTLRERIVRTAKTRLPRDYLVAPRPRVTTVEASELPLEFLMNALRLDAGFSRSQFEERTGLPASRLDKFLRRASSKGLIAVEQEQIRPTESGQQFLNSLLVMAMEDIDQASSRRGPALHDPA